MPKLDSTNNQFEAYDIASLRSVVGTDQSLRMNARLAELDATHETEMRRLRSLLATTKKILFGKQI
jgi:hypothetical protein